VLNSSGRPVPPYTGVLHRNRRQLASTTGVRNWRQLRLLDQFLLTAASLQSAPAGQNAFSIQFAMPRGLSKGWRMTRRGFALALFVLSAACGSTSLSASQTAPALGPSPQRVTTPLPILGPLRPIPNPPFPRSLSATAYDPLTGQTVMFGGLSNDGTLPDTWSWDGMSWTEHHSASFANKDLVVGPPTGVAARLF